MFLLPEIGRVAKVQKEFLALNDQDRRPILRSWMLKIKGKPVPEGLSTTEEGKLFSILALDHRYGGDMLDEVERWLRLIRKGEGFVA